MTMSVDTNMMSPDDFQRAVHENKCIAEMFADYVVLQAAKPNLTKDEQESRKLKRAILLPCCEVLATNNPEAIATALCYIGLALSIMSMSAVVPNGLVDTVSEHAKELNDRMKPVHERMLKIGVGLGTKLGGYINFGR